MSIRLEEKRIKYKMGVGRRDEKRQSLCRAGVGGKKDAGGGEVGAYKDQDKSAMTFQLTISAIPMFNQFKIRER